MNEEIKKLLEISMVTIPLVVGSSADDEWGVSMGGFNPDAEHYFPTPDEETAWRLHDAIYMLVMSTDPNLDGCAIVVPNSDSSLESYGQSLRDQMFLRQGIWNGFGLPQEMSCVGQKG